MKNEDKELGLIFLHPKRGLDLHPIHCPGCGTDRGEATIGHILIWTAIDGREFFAQIGKGPFAADYLGYSIGECISREAEAGEPVPSLDYCPECETGWLTFTTTETSYVQH